MAREASTTRALSAAIYCRISQDRDGTELGVTRQRDDCAALAKRTGWNVGAIYIDDDLSAYSGKPRPKYLAMLDALKAGTVGAVVAWHPDRLTRHPRELEDLIDLLESTGARVATVTAGDYDLGTPAGRMVARVVGAVARGESEHKSARIRRQREQAAQLGSPHGGRRAYGYDPTGSTLVDTEVAVIREAIERVLAGESVRSVARDLNRRGIRSSSGREWTVTALRTMLAGPRLAGLRVHRGEVVGPATWPALIDRETHERLVAATGNPREHSRGRPPVHVLAGLIVCGRCGAKMHYSKHVTGRCRYVCSKGASTDRCGRVAIVAGRTEELVIEAVLRVLDSPAVSKARKRRAGKSTSPDPGALLAALEGDLEAVAADHGAGKISRREWIAARDAMTERIIAVRAELSHDFRDQALASLRGVPNVGVAFDTLDTDRRRAVLGVVIDRIIIGTATRGPVWDPSRVAITWRA